MDEKDYSFFEKIEDDVFYGLVEYKPRTLSESIQRLAELNGLDSREFLRQLGIEKDLKNKI